jgi:L-ascorbate metabolism protein UlaG (beta-lactamase superfamily)
MDAPIRVTLVANTGLLLRCGNTGILADALFAPGEHGFSAPSPETWEKLLCGEPPFETVDTLLFTHLHSDHFSPERTLEFLQRRRVKGLLLPYAEELERQGFYDAVRESGTACQLLTERTAKTAFSLAPQVRVEAFRTLHLDPKYHEVPHFCYRITFGEKRLLLTADVDYTAETLDFLGEDRLRAAFVNPLFFSALRHKRLFRGTLPTEAVAVYHLPFPEQDGRQFHRRLARDLQAWPEDGPQPLVLDRELQSLEL